MIDVNVIGMYKFEAPYRFVHGCDEPGAEVFIVASIAVTYSKGTGYRYRYYVAIDGDNIYSIMTDWHNYRLINQVPLEEQPSIWSYHSHQIRDAVSEWLGVTS